MDGQLSKKVRRVAKLPPTTVGCGAPMDPLKRIVELLDDESPRKRIAAAVVLGELEVKDPASRVAADRDGEGPARRLRRGGGGGAGGARRHKALPVLLDALGRGKGLTERASVAIAAAGRRGAAGSARAARPAHPRGARRSSPRCCPRWAASRASSWRWKACAASRWDAVNQVALSVRQEAKAGSEAERKVMRTQVEKFLAKKKSRRRRAAAARCAQGARLPRAARHPGDAPPLPRQEADAAGAGRGHHRAALRAGEAPSKKALRKLMELLDDPEPLVARAARDTLTVLKIGPEFADELAELCHAADGEVALWAIAPARGELGRRTRKLAAKTLPPVARGADRARAEAAAQVLARLPGGRVDAGGGARRRGGRGGGPGAVGDARHHRHAAEERRQAAARRGEKQLGKSFAVARRQLEPVRAADPDAWGELLRDEGEGAGEERPDPRGGDRPAARPLVGRHQRRPLRPRRPAPVARARSTRTPRAPARPGAGRAGEAALGGLRPLPPRCRRTRSCPTRRATTWACTSPRSRSSS